MKLHRIMLLLLLLTLSALAQAPVDQTKIDQIVSSDMAAKLTPAVQIAIAKDGRIVYSKAFGIVDEENDLRATPQTLFRTGSIAKQLTAVAALTLVDSGKLKLDMPIQTYCPAFPLKQWTITTRELLSHTAGIRHYQGDEIESTKHYKFMADGMVIFENDPLLFEPGTAFNYSTYGYTVAGCVIEGAAHQPYFNYLHQHVLQPAGMEHTAVDDVYAIVPRRARGYQKENGIIENAGLMDSSYKIPGGGLDTTAEDLVRLGSALMNGKVLNRETAAEMWTPFQFHSSAFATSPAPNPSHYGLGWEIAESNGHKVPWHTGSQQGCNTAWALIPDEHFAVAVMTNMEGARPIDIVNQVLEAFAGVTTARPR
ncbi:MAG TPA: serine hydrolase domain-containing protein [Terriglobales bacterium]|nr:serine hydrolase domain-containing protein [Terriglobales bacterium]